MIAGTFTGSILAQVALPNSNATHYTAGSLPVRVSEILFCNTDTSDRTVRVYFVPAAGSIGPANAQFFDFPVPAKSSIPVARNAWLGAGGTIQGFADAAGVVGMTVSGIAET